MAGATIDNFGASFIHYLPGVVQTLNQTSNLRTLPKNKMKWEGRNLQWYVHLERNPAVSYIEDGGAFPAAGSQVYDDAQATRRFVVGSVQLTDGVLKNAATSKYAAISATESELTGMMTGIKKFENFFFTRDGTGVVGLVGATTSGATITVDDARGMWDGKDYEIRDTATPTTIHIASFTVDLVARALTSGESTVTPTASISAAGQAATDLIVWGTGTSSAYNRAITGLDALIDDSTAASFQNIDPAVYTRYTSPVLDNGGTDRALTPKLFRQALAMIRQESGEAPPSGMNVIGETFQAISWEELYEGEIRMSPDSSTSGIAISSFQSALGTINLVTDPDAPLGKLFFFDPEEIGYAVQAELDWRRDGPGGSIFKRSDTSAVYTATAMEISELYIKQRNCCAKIEDLTSDRVAAF